MKKHAMVVGISTYHDPDISPVPFADRDANEMAHALRHHCGFYIVSRFISGQQPEPENGEIFDALARAAHVIEEDDLFLFYFAGHGIRREGQGYLLTANSRYSAPGSTSLQLRELHDVFSRLACRHRVLILDACRNDPQAARGDEHNRLSREFARDVVAATHAAPRACPATTCILFACSVDQRAYAWPQMRQGAFTFHLLRGIEGEAWDENGLLTARGLGAYVEDRVEAWSKGARPPKPQRPSGHRVGSWHPIVLARRTTAPAPSPSPPPHDAAQEPGPPEPIDVEPLPMALPVDWREGLSSDSDATRRDMARRLAKCGAAAAPALGQLADLLTAPGARVREAARTAIAAIAAIGFQEVCLPGVERALAHDQSAVRRNALGLLATCGPAAGDAAPLVAACLAAEDPHVRAAAANAFVAIGFRDSCLATFERLLVAHGRLVCIHALATLAACGASASAAAAPVAAGLAADDTAIRNAAARALVAIGYQPQCRGAIARALGSSNPAVRRQTLNALVACGPSASGVADLVVPLLNDRNENLRPPAWRAQAAVGLDPSCLGALRSLLDGGGVSVRNHVLELLAEVAPSSAGFGELVIPWLVDKNDTIRDAATRALAALGLHESCLPALERIFRRRNTKLTCRALAALAACGPAAGAAAALIRAARTSRDPQVRASAEAAMRAIGQS